MIKRRRYRVIVRAKTEIFIPTTGPKRKEAVAEAIRNLEEYPDWADWQVTSCKVKRLWRRKVSAN